MLFTRFVHMIADCTNVRAVGRRQSLAFGGGCPENRPGTPGSRAVFLGRDFPYPWGCPENRFGTPGSMAGVSGRVSSLVLPDVQVAPAAPVAMDIWKASEAFEPGFMSGCFAT